MYRRKSVALPTVSFSKFCFMPHPDTLGLPESSHLLTYHLLFAKVMCLSYSGSHPFTDLRQRCYSWNRKDGLCHVGCNNMLNDFDEGDCCDPDVTEVRKTCFDPDSPRR